MKIEIREMIEKTEPGNYGYGMIQILKGHERPSLGRVKIEAPLFFHYHPVDTFYHFLSGSGRLIEDHQSLEIKEGMSKTIAAKVPHFVIPREVIDALIFPVLSLEEPETIPLKDEESTKKEKSRLIEEILFRKRLSLRRGMTKENLEKWLESERVKLESLSIEELRERLRIY